jgi:hypothetical protein
MGVFESASSTFLLLILVRWFQGGAAAKAVVAASNQGGLLLAPLTVFVVRHLRASVTRSAAILLGMATLCFTVAAFVDGQASFVALVAAGTALPSACLPLFTTMYQSNYPAVIRGRLFSRNNGIRIATSIVFGTAAGYILSGHIEHYHTLILTFAVALGVSAWAVSRVPDGGPPKERVPLLSCFKYIRSDRVLRETLVSWMLVGFGNLMMVPLRVEYLANPAYGLTLTEMDVAILSSTVPNIARLLGSMLWGRVFDTVSFFTLRIILNCSFLVSILSFFGSSSWPGLVVSAVIFGFSVSGGDVAWNLWVTKFAPPERVPDYMAVHTFFTGVRGLLAPAFTFALLRVLSPQQLSWLSGGLIFLSVLTLIPMQKSSMRAAPAHSKSS